MQELNNTNLNEKKINIFLDTILSKLGLNYANIGTRYLKEAIKIAYYNNMTDIKYKELCFLLSKELNVSIKKIDSNIYSSVNSININLAKRNFKDIFNIDFDYFYISPKKLLILLLNSIYNEKYI